MIDERQLIPVMPRLLLPMAPIVPATWVPWPRLSDGLFGANGSLESVRKFQPKKSSMKPLLSVSRPSAHNGSSSKSMASI